MAEQQANLRSGVHVQTAATTVNPAALGQQAARAAFIKDRVPGRDAAKTAATDNADDLLPSKLTELGGWRVSTLVSQHAAMH